MVANFKKSNINTSELMQNLAKIALDKGIIKNKEVVKTAASVNIDLTPTNDLNSNILILKAALEKRNLVKEARELESAFLFYAKAESTSYDLTKDLTLKEMETSHPGKEAIDVAGDAVVENLEEEHNAIMKAVANLNKKKDLNKKIAFIINASDIEKQEYFNLKKEITELVSYIHKVCEERGDLNWFSKTAVFNTLAAVEKSLSKPFLYVPDIKNLENLISAFEIRIDPSAASAFGVSVFSMGAGGLSENALSIVKPILEKVKTELKTLNELAFKISQEEDFSKLTNTSLNQNQEQSNTYKLKDVEIKSTEETRLITNNIEKLNSYKDILTSNVGNAYKPDEVKSGLSWIKDQLNQFNKAEILLEKNPNLPQKTISAIHQLDKEVQEFYNDWIK